MASRRLVLPRRAAQPRLSPLPGRKRSVLPLRWKLFRFSEGCITTTASLLELDTRQDGASQQSKLRAIEKLNDPDRKAVLRFVDALLAKQRLEHQR